MSLIDRLLSPDYVRGLDALDMIDLRHRRQECQDLESAQSYVRRLAQGRLDIVHAEIERRDGKMEGPDLERLISRLPVILADHASGSEARGQLIDVVLPDGDLAGLSELNEVIGTERLGALHELPESQLHTLADRLDEFERGISSLRHLLHERIDVLQREIVKRYKSGEATVDALLR
jgi:hypothetical protein